jgi:non-specific serine/threonine protein kinase
LGEQAPVPLQSHGHWMMKGVSAPVELFEAGEDPLHFAPPLDGEKVYRVVQVGERWLPAREIPNNLPQQATSFIGRERELGELRARLGTARLVTLLGMGGLGKTRLSLQVAAEVMAEFPDGAWFIDLSPIQDPALVLGEALAVLGVREEPGRPLLHSLCAHLASRRALLVLDNCEHLMKPAAALAHAVLKAAPGVRIMASSREALHVPGEQVVPILPLPVPGRGDSLDMLSRSPAVRLFVERAQAHKPAFSLTAAEAPAVAELVARLEGIPLALELAAARVRSLPVAEINKRLADRFKLLTGGSRVLQERQQTLRALVDWSYELLNENEQAVLGRLGVFAGGFDLGAAEVVAGADPLFPEDVMDVLGSLVEKSLVMLDERDGGARYRMLETIRDYARQKLALSDDDASATATRHCDHYFALAKEANRGLKGPHQAEWIARFDAELDNLRAATALALAGGVDPVLTVKFAVAMQGFWTLAGYATEGRALVHAALALPAVQAFPVAHAHALYVGAALAGAQSDFAEAARMLEHCLELRRAGGNPVDIAATLSTLAMMARLPAGDARGAGVAEEEALALFRQAGDRVGEGIGLLHLGQIAIHLDAAEAARDAVAQSLAIARELQYGELEAECELVLGSMALDAGSVAEADASFSRSLARCREIGDRRGAANAVGWLGRADLAARRFQAARARLGEAAAAYREFEMREELLSCLEDHFVLVHHSGAPTKAAALAAAADAARQRLGLVRSPPAQRRAEVGLAALRQALPPESFTAAWSEGVTWNLDEATKQALAATPNGASSAG